MVTHVFQAEAPLLITDLKMESDLPRTIRQT